MTINVPLTPKLALECGLDTAAWDAEGLFDCISVGPYHAYMNHPMDQWKRLLKHGTPVYAYVNCSPQTGQYLGIEEYRAAGANAYACGADGIYLFNYPCLFELGGSGASLPGRCRDQLSGHAELQAARSTKVPQALDELARPNLLAHKDKRFLFYWSNDTSYRHNRRTWPPLIAASNRNGSQRCSGAMKTMIGRGR